MRPDFFDFRTIRENCDTEFKSGRGKDGNGNLPQCIWETYSAMANTEGGMIFLGIKELKNDAFDFVGIKDFNKVIRDLWNGLNNPEKTSINLLKNGDIEPFEYQANRKQKPVYINGNPLRGTFRRNNEGDYRCPEDIVKQMLGDQINDTRDSNLMEGFSFEDVNLTTFQVFRQHFANRKPNHPFNDYNDQDFLRNIGGKLSEHLTPNSEHFEQLQQIAKKNPKDLVRQIILDLCQIKALSISEMAQLLNRKENSLRNHYINRMCDHNMLKRQYPNILNHPKQKYYTPKTK